MSLKPDTVLFTKMTESGIQNLTAGNVLSIKLRHLAVDTLRVMDPESYARYRALRGPKQIATVGSRQAALAFALQRVSEIAVQHYARVE